MNIYTSEQIKNWDQYTIKNEPISSIDLMERAAFAFSRKYFSLFPDRLVPVYIFCGPGNNGGDGLSVARILHQEGYAVQVIICEISPQFSEDFRANLRRLPKFDTIQKTFLKAGDPFPVLEKTAIIVDAIFGTGLNRPVVSYWADLIQHINQTSNVKVSIDIPSGLPSEGLAFGESLETNYTISFQCPKLSFFLSENSKYIGDWSVVPIGLDSSYEKRVNSNYQYITENEIRQILRPRVRFGHKGTYGHALIIAGSYGMVGAAQLCAKACLRSGAGLVTVYTPRIGYSILQTTVPEAMTLTDPEEYQISEIPDLEKYKAVAVGPGIGRTPQTINALGKLLKKTSSPLVIDADALNILAQDPSLLAFIPKNSILTPHPGEFKRLFGGTKNDLETLDLLQQKSKELKLIIILKGAYSRISFPDGNIFFNSTGNPGMATGGSGDVLTGILAGLLAQNYTPEEAALLGTFLHGSAGDIASKKWSQESMLAGEIIESLGEAFLCLYQKNNMK